MSSSARLCRIQPWEVPYIWEFVEKDLSRAIVHNNGESDMADLWRSLVTGSQTLWVVWDGLEIQACFTAFVNDYEKKRVFFVCLLAGRGMREFVKLEPELAEYARSIGCQAIESFVIPRVAAMMQRVIPIYKNTHQIMVREL